MSRGLTIEQLEALQLEGAKTKCLVEILHNSITWRFCTGHVATELNGNLYTPRPMRVSASTSGKVSGIHMTIELGNRDDMLSKDLKVDGLTGALASATLMTIIDDIAQAPVTLMSGDVTRCLIGDDLKIEVGPINKGNKAAGLLNCSRMCPYVYGGPLCNVASLVIALYPECRRDLVDCTQRSNEEHFGGFIWALEAGESIMVEGAPVQVQSAESSDSGAGGSGVDTCHTGWFVTVIRADGSTYQVEMRCGIEGLDNGAGDHTDGYYTDPWTLVVDDMEQEVFES